MEGDRKRVRRNELQGMLHLGGVSITGLSEILSRVGNIENCSATLLRDVNWEGFLQVRKVLPLTLASGEAFLWEIADLSKVLPAYLAKSDALRSLYAQAATKSPPTLGRPWSAVVAFDEFVPGNKMQAFYQPSQRVFYPRSFSVVITVTSGTVVES